MKRTFVVILTAFVETIPMINHRIYYKTEPRLVTVPISNDKHLEWIVNYFTAKYGVINYRIADNNHTVEEAEFELREELQFNS